MHNAFTQCPIPWRPNALGPVFYGTQDVGPGQGAPSRVRIFYPSLDGSPEDAPILTSCGQYPLVIFSHGQCTTDSDENPPPHYLRWHVLPAQLARAGYVVAVPSLTHKSNPSMNDEDLELLRALVPWMRSEWLNDSLLAPQTGLVGHSFGAMVGARLAAEGSIAAYASLSGRWQDWDPNGAPNPLTSIDCPKLFTWGDSLLDTLTALSPATWAGLSVPKHRVVFGALFAHWDYLPPRNPDTPSGMPGTSCEIGRGDCPHAGGAAIDIVTMCFGKYVPPSGTPELPERIPSSLVPPPLSLTPEQQFFAGGFLIGFRSFEDAGDICQADIAHETSEDLMPLKFAPNAIQFGTVVVGSAETLTLTVENPNEEADAVVLIHGASGSVLEWEGFSGTVHSGGKIIVQVTFRPASSAIVEAIITVTSNMPGSPYAIQVSGKGSGGFPPPERVSPP